MGNYRFRRERDRKYFSQDIHGEKNFCAMNWLFVYRFYHIDCHLFLQLLTSPAETWRYFFPVTESRFFIYTVYHYRLFFKPVHSQDWSEKSGRDPTGVADPSPVYETGLKYHHRQNISVANLSTLDFPGILSFWDFQAEAGNGLMPKAYTPAAGWVLRNWIASSTLRVNIDFLFQIQL